MAHHDRNDRDPKQNIQDTSRRPGERVDDESGAGRRDEVGKSGVYPMSGPLPEGDAPLEPMGKFGEAPGQRTPREGGGAGRAEGEEAASDHAEAERAGPLAEKDLGEQED